MFKYNKTPTPLIVKKTRRISTCVIFGCKNPARYGFLFGEKTLCSNHKHLNSVSETNAKCEKCDSRAFYDNGGTNYPKRCENHKKRYDCRILATLCGCCERMMFLNEKIRLCNECVDNFSRNIEENESNGFLILNAAIDVMTNSRLKNLKVQRLVTIQIKV